MDVMVGYGETPTKDRKILVFNDAHEQVDSFTLQKVDNNPENYDLSKNGYKVLGASADYLFIKAGFSNEKDETLYAILAVDKKQIGTGNITPFIVWKNW